MRAFRACLLPAVAVQYSPGSCPWLQYIHGSCPDVAVQPWVLPVVAVHSRLLSRCCGPVSGVDFRKVRMKDRGTKEVGLGAANI